MSLRGMTETERRKWVKSKIFSNIYNRAYAHATINLGYTKRQAYSYADSKLMGKFRKNVPVYQPKKRRQPQNIFQLEQSKWRW